MHILIASDKFKGSMSAAEACAAMARGVAALFPEAEMMVAPVADGGEGTAEAIRDALGGRPVVTTVLDPIGREVHVRYAIVHQAAQRAHGAAADAVAVMEMSAASGLWLLREDEKNPRVATTFGTGQMIADAAGRGVARMIVGIGGSATNDGGTGMAEALGYRFFDDSGKVLEGLPAGLERLASIEAPKDLRLPEVAVACDVTNPLLGERGATRVYGPQKGVRAEEIAFFEGRLRRLADAAARDLGCDARDVPGAGAAGGLGFGLVAFCGARLRSGFDLVAEMTGLERAVREADLVLTGEGTIDAQTAHGKAPEGVAKLARRHGVPVIAFGGAAKDGAAGCGAFAAVVTIRERHPELAIEECMARAEELIEEAVRNSRAVLEKALHGGSGRV